MEPKEPIRGKQDLLPLTDWRVFGLRRSFIFWLADYFMCWFAFCGLANAAVVLASFNPNSVIALSGSEFALRPQRVESIAIFVAVSTAGFTYMLWRYRWRYRLSTLFKIVAFVCALLAALLSNLLFVAALGVFVLVYPVIWACRRKDAPE
jgi:hypothetical protein